MPLDKVRIRFRKSGDLRLVSHLDLMRSFERMLRRASLPFRMTEGFHPAPRLVLALSLPLGIVGHNEVVELELTEEMDPDEVLRRLREQAPPGIDFHSAKRIAVKTTARPRRAMYCIAIDDGPSSELSHPIPSPRLCGARAWSDETQSPDSASANPPPCPPPAEPGGGKERTAPLAASIPGDSTIDDLQRRCDEFMIAKDHWAGRERPKPRLVNIRPYVDSLMTDGRYLLISIWITQEGSARADEVAAAVGIVEPRLIERVDLELMDEVPPETAAQTPKIESQTRPWNRVISAVPTPAVPRETWGATANGPVVE